MQHDLIRQCRQMALLSQQEFSELVGVSQPLIARIESGDIQAQPMTLQKIKTVLAEQGVGSNEVSLLSGIIEVRKFKRE